MRTSSVLCLAAISAALVTLASSTATMQTSSADPDVVGLRLGMTEGQAMAALRAYNPAVRIRPVADTLPTPAGTRYTRMLYAGVFGDDRAGIGDETFKVEFSNPSPEARIILVWRRQTYPAGRELTVENVLAAFRDKYGPQRFARTTAGLANWTWATGAGGQPPADHSPCIVHQQVAMALTIQIVTSGFVEPRTHFADPRCGSVLDMVISSNGPLATSIVTTLTDFAGGMRTRMELEEMSRRPDNRAIEADQRGRPKL